MLAYKKKLNKSIKKRKILIPYRRPLISRRMRRKIVRRIRPAIYALNLKRKRRAILKGKKKKKKYNKKRRKINDIRSDNPYTSEIIAIILGMGQNRISINELGEYRSAITDSIKKNWPDMSLLDREEKIFNINFGQRLLAAIQLKLDLQKESFPENEEFIDLLFDYADNDKRKEAIKTEKARDRSQLVRRKSILYLRNTKKFHLLEAEREERSKKLLRNMILLDLVMAAKLEMGERIYTNNKNEKIKNYFMGIRNDHAIYNMNLIIIGLRLTLGAITSRIKYKKRTLINYSNPRNHGNFHLSYKPIHEFPKDLFLVTWKKWIGGILTNFKRLSKRIISRMKHDKQKNKDNKKLGKEDMEEDYRIAFPRDVPKLPAFVVSTTDCHWTLNESKRMKISTTQLIEISHLGYFGDINLAINTHYLGLRSFTSILQECILHVQRNAKFLHKGNLVSLLDITTLNWPGNNRQSRIIANKFAPKSRVSKLFDFKKNITKPTKPQNSNIAKQLKGPSASKNKQIVSKPQPPIKNPVVVKPREKVRIIQSPDRFQFPDKIQRAGGYLSLQKIRKNPEKYAFNPYIKEPDWLDD